MRHRLPFVAVILALLAAACAPAASPDGPQRLNVVATFSVLGDMVRVIGGEHVNLTVLAGPGLDTHTFVPTAADAAALAEAKLVVENGLGFESWLDDLYLSSGSLATRAVAATGITPLVGGAHDHEEDDHADDDHAEDEHADDEHAEDDEHADGAPDPHIWHSAANAIVIARNLNTALAAADPAHAAAYQANTDAYVAELQALDEWITTQVSALPAERRKLVTTHDTFGYFAQRYGFEVLGTILPTSTEGASPSAQSLAALVEAVQAAGVPAVFAENVGSNSLLNQLAAEAGVQVVATLFTDALGPAGSGGETYVDMMRSNVTTIVAALGS